MAVRFMVCRCLLEVLKGRSKVAKINRQFYSTRQQSYADTVISWDIVGLNVALKVL